MSDVTPGRKTHVWMDVPEYVLCEGPFAFEREARQMARSRNEKHNIEYRSGVGITLQHTHDDKMFSWEQDASSTEATMSVAPGISSAYLNRKIPNSELNNVNPGGGVASQSGRRWYKATPTGSDLADAVLSADQGSFPGPMASDPNYPVDRLAISADRFQGFNTFAFEMTPYFQANATPDEVSRFYFPGPASETDAGTGTGRYVVRFYGNGVAGIEEFTAAHQWVERARFQYGMNGIIGSQAHGFVITCSPEPTLGQGSGGTIHFKIASLNQSRIPRISYVATVGAIPMAEVNPAGEYVYNVPILGDAPRSYECPLRVDIRRDLDVFFQVYTPHYLTSGEFTDDPITLDRPVSDLANLVLVWEGVAPTGTSLTLDLIDRKTNTVLTPVSTTGNYREYASVWNHCDYAVKVTFAGTTAKTPVLKAYRLYRDPVYGMADLTPYDLTEQSGGLIQGAVTNVRITGQDKDPSHETATIEYSDVTNSHPQLRTRQASILVSVDDAASGKNCKIFRGYANQIKAERKGRNDGHDYPNDLWFDYEIHAAGMWQRLYEKVYGGVQFSYHDPSTGNPYKVTDIISGMLTWAGFPPEMQDITPSDILLWGNGVNTGSTIDPLANIGETIQKLLYEYLGHFLTFDPNAGDYGKWRTIAPNYAPYTNVAAFTITGPEAGEPRIPNSILAYPAAVSGGGLTYAAGSPTVPIISGTVHSDVVPPDANVVIVTTLGLLGPNGVSDMYRAKLINFMSFNANPSVVTADPNHPDYLGREVPLYIVNSNLAGLMNSGKNAVNATNWVCRRVFDVACHGYKRLTFMAPMVFIPHDKESGKLRMIRYHDAVTVDDQQYLVRSVTPAYHKDNVQFAMYELQESVTA